MTRPVIKRPQGGGMQPMFTQEEIDWIAYQRERCGKTYRELGEILHCHPTTVRRWAERAGVPRRPRVPPPKMLAADKLLETVALAGDGYSASDIATLLGLHPTTVRWRLKHYARDQNWRNRPHRLKEHAWPKGM